MFERLKQERPGALEKVTAIGGDLTQPGLGLSASDWATLVDNVSVVFHSGATVKFEEPLRSTENYTKGVNKELLFGHPNTYSLTKNFAESLVLDERGNIPVAIVRPSIVTAALSEPLPLGLGLLPSIITEKNHLTDIVPVDIVANTLICVAWHTSTRPTHVKVYHCASGTLQQHTWGDLFDAMQKSILRYPLPNAMCYPKFSVTNSHLWPNVNLYCLRYLPALVADLFPALLKRETRFVKLFQNARKSTDVAEYFMSRGWLFRIDNVVRLSRDLTPKDKQASLEMDNAEIANRI
ncbi:hypothetical protein HPB50_004815 [Hyalomma asiaticum]|uniref:Uncharacterized protein n=1 Tax=Hyalomma asiaticum TaxID=266040 RepID=A0ACB7SMI8_HYAAI|nr:hypothetical protein HPB50_004815 [Hyalomma asiaticum]